jgi:hypothetical protein
MSATYKQFGKEIDFILQPDYQFTHNGYGLLQLTANYAIDSSNAGISSVVFRRGEGFRKGTDSLSNALADTADWTVVKAEEKGRDGELTYFTVYYAGIAGKASTSDTECTMTSSTVSEPIESHPNFSVIQCPQIGGGNTDNVLGGIWEGNNPPPLEKPTGTPNPKNKFRAIWNISFNTQTQTKNITFAGFSPTDNTSTSTANEKAGVRSWMRPTVTLKLTAYTNNGVSATDTVSRVGWIQPYGSFGVLSVPDVYKNIITNDPLTVEAKNIGSSSGRNWLCTSANMEVYGGLYKVTADLLLSGVLGWDGDIYPNFTQDTGS